VKKKVLVRGPVLSQSGYGEHTRFVLRSLRLQEGSLDIHILPTGWGETGWLAINDEERTWIDERINVTTQHMQQKLPYDMSVQVTIPNEWQKMAHVNIGVTAGIECNKVSPVWLEKANEMNKIITISEHSRQGLVNTAYHGHHKDTGQEMQLRCTVPVDVVGYPVKTFDIPKEPILELDYDFNYLTIAQWGPRKNLHNLIKWFVEENIDQEVGLVIKTSLKNNSVVDREYAETMVRQAIPDMSERKCKIYLLHGDMSEEEMHSLYHHPKIKSLISLTHGEGFGLPLFEAAYSGLPVIAPGWSGQCDFLYAPLKSTAKKRKKRKKKKAFFADVDFNISPVPEDAVWEGVIEKETMWAFPTEGSFKIRLRQVRKNYNKWLEKAAYLKKWIHDEFASDKMHERLSFAISEPDPSILVKIGDLPKISIITSVYDGDDFIRPFLEDITKQTIFEEKCELILINADSPGNEEIIINEYLEKYPNNIVYKKLDEDPGVYGVWNIGAKMATGEFLTNANLDDRKAPHSLEKHAKTLYASPGVDLVYADLFITDKPNETFEDSTANERRYNFPDFSFENLQMVNMPHNNPMWRKNYHEKYGYFNELYTSAGDWEMWLRGASQGSKFKKIHEVLGLYYFNPVGISTNPDNFSRKSEEEAAIYEKYAELV